MSSSLDDTRERAQVINKNHVEMCRFSGADDPGYRQVGGELKDLVEDIDSQQEDQNRQKLYQAEEGKVPYCILHAQSRLLKTFSNHKKVSYCRRQGLG